jgi:hypothetical protein
MTARKNEAAPKRNIDLRLLNRAVSGQTEADRISAIQELLEENRFNPTSRREQNVEVIREAATTNKRYVRFREAMKKRYGLNIEDQEKFPIRKQSFSWARLQERLADTFAEADSETAFVQFLRAGVQTVAMDAFETVDTTFEDWVFVVNSNRLSELYAPNHGIGFPREVGNRMRYPEVGAAALDLQLRNRKYGSMYPVEYELLEDDQTGTFQRQSALLGEYLKLVGEVVSMGKLASVPGMRYIDLEVRQSETKPANEANYPWTLATAPFVGGGWNKLAPVAIGLAPIQAMIVASKRQKNLQGIKMQVNLNRLIIGPAIAFDTAVLLHSAYYPVGASAAGVTGGAFAVNPLGPEAKTPFKTIANVTMSQFMFKNDGTCDGDSTAWYGVDDKKPGFVVQYREPVSITQEAPNSGQSFEQDTVRFKGRTRMNADFIDPRYLYQGNDGSV